ncbi:MAG: hypothetical protein ABS69_06505 [Nitrosomonadales bacterium SCN 54-20]|nr:MAG: hypothetical protein ABS69_06505 [Nitrosomonadales bacterium SCN 54-20]
MTCYIPQVGPWHAIAAAMATDNVIDDAGRVVRKFDPFDPAYRKIARFDSISAHKRLRYE